MVFNIILSVINRRRKKKFHKIGENVKIPFVIRFSGYERISIGGGTFLDSGSWFAAQPLTGDDSCSLFIGSNCSIGRHAHFFATSSIILEDSVIVAERVYISDNLHGYEDINKPIIEQKILQKHRVIIGEGSWLGENVCVIGATVGRHCVIGANSVVTRDIPDYCVAVGAPARVIKRYSFEKGEWEECV